MYAILSTFPAHGSGNVGDKLLEEQVKRLITRERGVSEFEVFYRGRDFSSHVDRLNAAEAVILPAFAIREPLHPDTYALTEHLTDIESPLIPIAANWSHYPGDKAGNETLQYQPETRSFLQYLLDQPALSHLTTRDIYTKRVLERHGFDNVELVGDLAWYHEEYLGDPMRVPSSVDHVVMTTPHNAHYLEQATDVMDMLLEEFPDATHTCSFHSVLSTSDRRLRERARDRGFEIVLASHDTDNIAFYDDCDLHVGYRLHGHISFLRRRLPSVLIGEDGRGNGFNATLGVAGFEATKQRFGPRGAMLLRRMVRSLPVGGRKRFAAGPKIRRLIAPADGTVPKRVRTFLQTAQAEDFAQYDVVPELFDRTYEEAMAPFLQNLP